MARSIIIGTGSHIPSVVVPNSSFLQNEFRGPDGEPITKSNEEIVAQFEAITGIRERRWVPENLVTSDIATAAARQALDSADIDAETLDLVRADLKVNRIPSYVGVSSIEKSLHYKMIRIGDTDFLLPHNAEMTAVDDHGIYSLNMVSIDGCREFTGESIITYTGPAQGTASRDRPDQK